MASYDANNVRSLIDTVQTYSGSGHMKDDMPLGTAGSPAASAAGSAAGSAVASAGSSRPNRARPRARNRNAERSIRLLQEAFVQLLAEKPYDKITVSDITRKADLNRGTFYAHYSSIDDLMNRMMDSLAISLVSLVEQVIDLSFIENPMPVLQMISGFIQENLALVQRLMESQSISDFTGPLKERVRGQIKDYLTVKNGENATRDLLVADYISSGMFGIYNSWIAGEYGDASLDEINAVLCNLVHGARSTLLDSR
ncbi:MAG: TetR/AcrR family transcriptional regulator [Atopobiaceae bacterium]|jgi:AcrR family transcriptional regulator